MKHYDHPQGSDAWLQLRVGKITASRYKDARDFNAPTAAEKKEGATRGKPSAKCTAYAAQVAVERIAARAVEETFQSWQMREGQEQEPLARAAYDVETGNVVQEVGAFATDDDLFLYSPDGLIGNDGLLEIKTLLSPAVILRVIGDGDLSAYMDQCLGGLWLTGRQWIDLVLWAPALEPIGRALTIHRITRDENAIEALEADLVTFSRMVLAAEKKLRAVPGLIDPPPDTMPAKETAAPEKAVTVAHERAAAPATTTAEVPPAPAPTPAPAPAPVTTVEAFTEQRSTVVPMRPAGPPTLTLTEINRRLGRGKWSEEDLTALGFPPAGRAGASKLWHVASLDTIFDALIAHFDAAQRQQRQAA